MSPLVVRHARGEYPVHFADFGTALASLPEGAAVITDTHVQEAWGHVLGPLDPLVVPAGEGSKCLTVYGELLEALAQRGVRRDGTVVAVGGGVVGDLAGFVAASYLRGVKLMQIPTTLLSQVDSSVGGKVGIDLTHGKNLAGAFHPPSAVWIAPETLGTLPVRQWTNGLAEVWKAAWIADPDVMELARPVTLRPDLTRSEGRDTVLRMVRRCIEIKAEVVESDEFETTGRRAILNFGHTIGHAVEHLSGFRMLHGEAIAVGMVLEARLGERLGVTPPGTADRLRTELMALPLPVDLPDAMRTPDAREELMHLMRKDKKATVSGVGFSLLERLGACKLFPAVPEHDVREVLLPA